LPIVQFFWTKDTRHLKEELGFNFAFFRHNSICNDVLASAEIRDSAAFLLIANVDN